MCKHYILGGKDGKTPVPTDMMTWAKSLEKKRAVARDELPGSILVSTVFLGLDHRFGEGPPLLFETMIFGGKHDQYQTRCSTWKQALKQHQIALDLVNGIGRG